MVDNLEDEKSESLDLERCLGIVRRRHLHFLIPLFIGWTIVWAASWVLPPRYQSSTLILVEEPTMPKDYVKPNINDDLQHGGLVSGGMASLTGTCGTCHDCPPPIAISPEKSWERTNRGLLKRICAPGGA